MRLPKYNESQKSLCKAQDDLIHKHLQICGICKKSYEEYNRYGVSSTPMCNSFESKLRNHISMCGYCQGANKRWNKDAIPTIPEMRQVTSILSRGELPNPVLLNKVRDYLIEKLELTSLEIGQMNDTIEKLVRGQKP